MAEIHQILMIFTKLAISQSVLHQKRCSWTRFVGGGYVNLYPYPDLLVPIPATHMGMPYPCICLPMAACMYKYSVNQVSIYEYCYYVYTNLYYLINWPTSPPVSHFPKREFLQMEKITWFFFVDLIHPPCSHLTQKCIYNHSYMCFYWFLLFRCTSVLLWLRKSS